ncbi:hypothetical protein VTN31DRAFT_2810 [Thermomyces dupontii]|uniref:uncharacterized protein n=1 Tax=Talaromyces thermophilus TaxID=28565 RepID=UPI00374475E5
MTEDSELLERIRRLAGRINQHKSQLAQNQHAPPPHYARHHRGGWAPYRTRGAPRRPITHRNRTLVLNQTAGNTAESSGEMGSDNETKPAQPGGSGWVAKRDRHMQLINSAVYDREAQARAKAMAETQKRKAEKRAKMEEAKVMRYAQGFGQAHPGTATAATQRPMTYQIFVNGIPFQVANGGSKLIRLSNDPNTVSMTPKRVSVGGVTFVRSKKGNLHRLGAVTSKRKPGKVKKRDELCKRFSRTGTCYKGPSCPYIHDPNKVAICKEFLQTGKCPSGDCCDLSHEPCPERSPVCVHFLRGRCSNPECRYAHVRVTPGAPVCRAFGILGYCEKGAACLERHIYECPDYANTGVCKKNKCTLPHVDRAGQIRKNAANRAETTATEEDEDVSSEDEDDAIDSDDVDSDELDEDDNEPTEIIVDGGSPDVELSGQQDFVRF